MFIACLSVFLNGFASEKWELKKDADGIKVYTAAVPNTNIKAIKVECTINASLSQLTAFLLDAKAHENWVYSTKQSYMVKQLAPNHQVYYSEMTMPWPLTNRDVVVDLMITQDPTKVLTVKAVAVKGYVEQNKNKVRVPLSVVNWTVTPLSKSVLKIDYVAQADPGGAIPAWVVNMFITKGPFETFKSLRKAVSAAKYSNASFDFITD
jgi:hypothetical protein